MQIIGLRKSGLSLIAGIFRAAGAEVALYGVSMEDYRELDISMLDTLHARLSDIQTIWVIRDPSVFISKLVLENSISAYDAARCWFDANTVLWHASRRFKHIIVKFEEAILKTSVMQNAFDFAGLEYKHKYLRYGDFDQPNDLFGKSFNRGSINIEEVDGYDKSRIRWKEVEEFAEHPLLEKLGYTIRGNI